MSEDAGRAEEGITEITLSSETDDDEHLKPEHINLEYVQEQRFKGVKRSFMIFNDTQLYAEMNLQSVFQYDAHARSLQPCRRQTGRQGAADAV